MKKGAKIGLIIGGIAVIAIAIIVYSAVFTTATRTAYLMVEGSGVEVDSGKGWGPAGDMMDLSLDDKIRTNSAKATVIFYDTIIVSLEPGTEISIKELSESNVQVEQESGSTWHKFTKIVGVDSYKVSTPRAVATIRGTEVGINVNANSDDILLGEGDADVTAGGITEKLIPLEVLVVNENGEMERREMNLAEKGKVLEFMKQNIGTMKIIRNNEISAHEKVVEAARAKYAPEKTIAQILDEIDKGQTDDNPLVENSPVKIPALYKLKAIDDEIKKSQWVIGQIESGAEGEEIHQRIQSKPYLFQAGK